MAKKSISERFWSKVDKAGDCWEWMTSKDPDGYGQFSIKEKNLKAHRAAWSLINGPIPDGLCCLHHCDNPGCVNPDHLFLGTHQDNARDRDKKGRHVAVRGEERVQSKLTEDDVLLIRSFRGFLNQRELSSFFGVSQSLVSLIQHHHIWKHVS